MAPGGAQEAPAPAQARELARALPAVRGPRAARHGPRALGGRGLGPRRARAAEAHHRAAARHVVQHRRPDGRARRLGPRARARRHPARGPLGRRRGGDRALERRPLRPHGHAPRRAAAARRGPRRRVARPPGPLVGPADGGPRRLGRRAARVRAEEAAAPGAGREPRAGLGHRPPGARLAAAGGPGLGPAARRRGRAAPRGRRAPGGGRRRRRRRVAAEPRRDRRHASPA